ncbi:MAG: hypothetical protein WD078_04410 [Woeseia sp.]
MTRRWYPGSRGLLLAVSGLPALAGLAAALWVGADIDALRRVLATPGIELSMASALWSGAIATAIALFLAHIAMALAATGGWRRSLNNLALPLLAMPHLAVGIGLVLVLAPSGLLLRLVSPWASGLTLPPDWQTVQDPFGLSLIAGLVIKETCFLLLVLHAALSQVPAERLLQQARSLGYGRIKGWFVAVAPLLQRQIRLPLAAVLVFGMTNVELAIPLGPGLPPTFAVLLWQWFTDPDPQIHAQAYTGTLLLFAMTLLVLGGAAACGAAVRRVSQHWATGGARGVRERGLRYGLSGLLAALWALGMLAVVAIILRSASGTWRFPAVLPSGDVLSAWRVLAPPALDIAPQTVMFAIATAVAGLLLVLPAAESVHRNTDARRLIGALLFLPLLLPQMTFLFGVQVLLTRLRIDGTFVAVLWSHLIFALPYLWSLVAPARAAIDLRFADVARTLGASRQRTWWRITAPLLARTGLVAFALAFSVSVALYLPTLFAGAGRVATAATEAAAAAASGSLRLASMHAILLSVLPFFAFAIAYTGGALLFRQRRGVPR